MTEPRILTDDELRQIGALQVTPGSWGETAMFDGVERMRSVDGLSHVVCLAPEKGWRASGDPELLSSAPDLLRTALHLLQRAEEAESNYAFMVARAADQRLDGYRELGAKCAALEAERDDLRARLAVALDGCCPDCGGSGIGSDACDGPGHHTPPCPSCEGSGLTPDGRRLVAQRDAAWAERDAAQARVAELEAPGECNSIHKLRAQVADLQAVVERVRPVVDVLAEACSRCAAGTITDVATRAFAGLMIPMGRGDDTFDVAAAWFRSLLLTAPDPAHRPGHTDLMVAPESVPDLAPQPQIPDGRPIALPGGEP